MYLYILAIYIVYALKNIYSVILFSFQLNCKYLKETRIVFLGRHLLRTYLHLLSTLDEMF